MGPALGRDLLFFWLFFWLLFWLVFWSVCKPCLLSILERPLRTGSQNWPLFCNLSVFLHKSAFAVHQVSSKIVDVSRGQKCTRGTSTIFHLCNNSTRRHKSHVYALGSICLLASSHDTAHRHFLYFITVLPFSARKNNPVCYDSSRFFSIFSIFA